MAEHEVIWVGSVAPLLEPIEIALGVWLADDEPLPCLALDRERDPFPMLVTVDADIPSFQVSGLTLPHARVGHDQHILPQKRPILGHSGVLGLLGPASHEQVELAVFLPCEGWALIDDRFLMLEGPHKLLGNGSDIHTVEENPTQDCPLLLQRGLCWRLFLSLDLGPARPGNPIGLSPRPIIHQVFFDDQRDVPVCEIWNEIAINCSLDDGITPGAVTTFLHTGLGVPEIPGSDLRKGLAGHWQVLGFALLELAQNLKRNLFGFLQNGLTRGASDIATVALDSHTALPDAVLHIIALIEGDFTVRNDILVESMGHKLLVCRHEQICMLCNYASNLIRMVWVNDAVNNQK
jgi:hypothetical protein